MRQKRNDTIKQNTYVSIDDTKCWINVLRKRDILVIYEKNNRNVNTSILYIWIRLQVTKNVATFYIGYNRKHFTRLRYLDDTKCGLNIAVYGNKRHILAVIASTNSCYFSQVAHKSIYHYYILVTTFDGFITSFVSGYTIYNWNLRDNSSTDHSHDRDHTTSYKVTKICNERSTTSDICMDNVISVLIPPCSCWSNNGLIGSSMFWHLVSAIGKYPRDPVSTCAHYGWPVTILSTFSWVHKYMDSIRYRYNDRTFYEYL